ncbi:1-acylglycerol-3-phosphate O-acyltransferase Pnpla3-like [Haliotis asinina]|uniref:1-acylglycerol-3-phosphate O-acyltransferase Pnpla3-like n=1 Tax=Haliotis asinina TaxID=109174 RepID=UPI0035322E31
MSFSFSGCGFLGIYHIGVASCLREHAPHFFHEGKLLGASAGAITACCFLCGTCLGECTSFTLRLATKARSRSLGPLHPSFAIDRILRDALWEVLPDNAHEIVSGRLFVSLTRVSDKKCVIVSEFDSKEELIQALLCSAFVPFYSGLIPPKFRGVRYVDGGLSDNLPILDEDTITVSPFSGESDICPSDGSSNFLHITLVNTSMQCTTENLYRLSHALFPPHPEVLSDMCRQGFDDALVFLQTNNMISCTRHLSVRSCISTTDAEEKDSETEQSEEDEEHDESDDEDADCEECKKKLHGALVDSLPPSVMLAFQHACDSVNKGLVNYFYNSRPVKLLSLAATPWVLPAEMAVRTVVKFLQWLPSMPQDVQSIVGDTVELLKIIAIKMFHHHPRYSARFTCQLAITEVKDPKETPRRSHLLTRRRPSFTPANRSTVSSRRKKYPEATANNSAIVRNFNIGFAVDFNTSKPSTVQSLEHLHGHMDKLHMDDVQIQQSSPTGDLLYLPRGSDHCSASNAPCQEIFDTFEQCLHITNQMESALSYYYEDPTNKGCYKFEEIFSLKNVDVDLHESRSVRTGVCESSTEVEESLTNTSTSEPDLSWDSYLEMKPEIEDELEALIDSALSIPQLQSTVIESSPKEA